MVMNAMVQIFSWVDRMFYSTRRSRVEGNIPSFKEWKNPLITSTCRSLSIWFEETTLKQTNHTISMGDFLDAGDSRHTCNAPFFAAMSVLAHAQ